MNDKEEWRERVRIFVLMARQDDEDKHIFCLHTVRCQNSYRTIQFSVSTVSISKTVPFQTIQFGISTQFKCKYSLIVKTFRFKAIQFS